MPDSSDRNTQFFANRIHEVQEGGKDVTMNRLFAEIDTDGSGTLSKEEFAKMYNGIRTALAEENVKLNRTKRRARLTCAIAAALIPVVLILLAGNMGLVYTLLETTKETRVNSTEHTMRAASDGSLLRVGAQMEETAFTFSDALKSYDTIKKLDINGLSATVLASHVLEDDIVTFYTHIGVFKIDHTNALTFTASDPVVQRLYDAQESELSSSRRQLGGCENFCKKRFSTKGAEGDYLLGRCESRCKVPQSRR